MPYEVYKVLHITALILLFMGLSASTYHAIMKGPVKFPERKLLLATHGVGSLLLLISGFGLLARVNITWPWPGWILVKLALWIVLGAIAGLILKKQGAAKLIWWLLPVSAALAAYMVNFKPF